MSRVPVKVVIDDAHMNAQEAVERAVSALGFVVERSVPEIGAIFGSAEASVIDRLRGVDGVLRAQPEASYHLPPFDPKIPQ